MNLYCSFCTETQDSFIIDYGGVGEEVCECFGVWGERGLNKWNQAAIIKIS